MVANRPLEPTNTTIVANEMATACPHYDKQRTTTLYTTLYNHKQHENHDSLIVDPCWPTSTTRTTTTAATTNIFSMQSNILGSRGTLQQTVWPATTEPDPTPKYHCYPHGGCSRPICKKHRFQCPYDILPFVSWLLHRGKMWSASGHAESANHWVGVGPRRIRKL